MQRLLFLFLLLLGPLGVMAQDVENPVNDTRITGHIVDKDTQEGVLQVTVQVLRSDSTFVTGVISDEDGNFTVTVPQGGKYILKMTSVGYITLTKNVTTRMSETADLGDVIMSSDAIMLKGTTVTGQAVKVTVKEDTFVYNSSAYRTPEGSAIEELVKRLPGAEISDDGTIKINGKEVKKIKVDGKEFMTGDTKTALKNLPTSIVDRIKSYDEKSDLARVTGIDDGEEQTVLDFGLKKGMNKGLFANVDLSVGTRSRYAEKLMGAYFNDKYRLMLFGNANNTNDMGFPGGGGRGRFGAQKQGLNTAKMLGLNFNYDDGKKLKMDASVRWNHNNGDVLARSNTENFVSTIGSFTNSLKQSYTRSNSWDGRFRLEWQPDSLTNVMFRPSLQWSTSDSNVRDNSATFNEDPYEHGADDPLDEEFIEKMHSLGLLVNTRKNVSITYGETFKGGGMLQLNRRLSSEGRNVTLRSDVNFSNVDNNAFSISDYTNRLAELMDASYLITRYNITPTDSRSWAIQTTYSEPIATKMYLQFSYKYQYKYNKSDRSTYDFSDLGHDFIDGVVPRYRGWDSYLSRLTIPMENYLDDDLSRYSEYKNYIHELQLMYRWVKKDFQLNAGLMLQPQSSDYTQDYQGQHIEMERKVTNFSPTFDFRYKFSKVSNLRVNYRGYSTQPSMSDLIDIVDDSDPLNITMGNPGLKPSFTNNFRLFYNTYMQNHQRAIMTFVNFTNTRNSIGNSVTYDALTGARTIQPVNVNGNWNTNMAFMFNTAIDSTGFWNVNTFTDFGYNHYVGYLATDPASDAQRNVTRTSMIGERLSASYRNSWLEVDLNGSLNYTHARNKLQSSSDLDTWQFAYGVNVNLTAPWGTSLSTGLTENSRRGYNDSSMNTNELVWNAQVSHSFLQGNALTVTLQFYDILHEQSNISRTINDMMRTDTEYNSINSYGMLHVIYKMNLFGGKSNMGRRHGDGPPEGGPGGPGGHGGPPPGGFGGGRPGGGGGFGGGRPGGGRF